MTDFLPDKPACPQCSQSDRVIPIVYGRPTKALLEQMGRGEIELGGHIVINGNQPPWTCIRCHILIGRENPPKKR